ncbi:MAG: hypothetical protein ACTTKS_05810 [Bulleidia sp.]
MMKKSALTFLSICLLFALAGCGDKSDSTTNPPESDTSKQVDSTGKEDSSQDASDITKFDYSSPSIVIEFGDVDAITDLASKAQSFAVEEGTIAKITGLYSKGGSHPSIDQDAGDGKYEGLVMFVEGDYDEPEDMTKVEVTGVFLKGQYYMEFHVPAENIKTVE